MRNLMRIIVWPFSGSAWKWLFLFYPGDEISKYVTLLPPGGDQGFQISNFGFLICDWGKNFDFS
jgi:hypothetical protein